MPIPDFVHAPSSPDELNAYYLRIAPITDILMADDQQTVDGRIYSKMYNSKVKGFNPAGKGISRRQVRLEHRRSNQRFSNDWETWKRGCGPQTWNTKTLGRPGVSETWSYLQHLSYDSAAYHLKTIITDSLSLPDQIEQDIRYLETVKRDIYDTYFKNFHLTFSERHWMAYKTSAADGAKFKFDDKIGGGSWAAPWRFAQETDGCLSNTDRIYVNPDATDAVTKITSLTPKAVRQIQRTYAANDPSGAYKKVTLITSDIAPEQIISADTYYLDALKRLGGNLSSGAVDAVINHNLRQSREINSLMNFEVDQQVYRYKDTGETNDDGEMILERVEQYLDLNTNSDRGVRTVENPDWQNPMVAAFEIYVVGGEPIYTPMRPEWPETLGHNMTFGPSPMARWEWFNVQNMEYNRNREWGFFGLQDDLMAVSRPEARSASVILVRRQPEDFDLEDIAGALEEPEYVSQTPKTVCADVQYPCGPPDCAPTEDGFLYPYGQTSPSCPNCM